MSLFHGFFSCCNKTLSVRRSLQKNKTLNLVVQTSTSCISEENSQNKW